MPTSVMLTIAPSSPAPSSGPSSATAPAAAGQNSATVNAAGDTASSQQGNAAQAVTNNAPQAHAGTGQSLGPVNPAAFAFLLEQQMDSLTGDHLPQAVAGKTDDTDTATAGKTDKPSIQDEGGHNAGSPLPSPLMLLLPLQLLPAQSTAENTAATDNEKTAAIGKTASLSALSNTQALASTVQATAPLPIAVSANAQSGTDPAVVQSLTVSLAGTGVLKLQDDAREQQNLPQNPAMLQTILPAMPANQNQTQAASAESLRFQIPQQVDTPDWSKSLADHVMAMVSLKADSAQIQLNPPHLGPIEVNLRMDGQNNAQVSFTADSAATRAALQDSLPKLHTMMAASGIQLGDAQVSSGQSQRQQQQGQQRSSFSGNVLAVDGEEQDTLAAIKAARGVLSIFA